MFQLFIFYYIFFELNSIFQSKINNLSFQHFTLSTIINCSYTFSKVNVLLKIMVQQIIKEQQIVLSYVKHLKVNIFCLRTYVFITTLRVTYDFSKCRMREIVC